MHPQRLPKTRDQDFVYPRTRQVYLEHISGPRTAATAGDPANTTGGCRHGKQYPSDPTDSADRIMWTLVAYHCTHFHWVVPVVQTHVRYLWQLPSTLKPGQVAVA